MGDLMNVTPGSSTGDVLTIGAPVGSDIGGLVSLGGNGGFDPREELTTGRPLVPRRILSLNPSSSTANSVSSERFMRSMICLICFRSKGVPWLS